MHWCARALSSPAKLAGTDDGAANPRQRMTHCAFFPGEWGSERGTLGHTDAPQAGGKDGLCEIA